MYLQSNWIEVSGMERYESTVFSTLPTGYCAVKQNKKDVVETNYQGKWIRLPKNIFYGPSLTHQVSEDDWMALSRLTDKKK